ncbi:hypothetical protein PCASD_22420 [Puccinia coronata f. sp. avenae]|uniref:Thioredoxin domain-containing protein n=1 Tax=Puccinia coronata f. sp. avenae TaxID=200324 RepID=A0A2N5SSY7_9BASI|nr:hypothetical protein PCASD_22420 [Puccinia coronata f. sp. avenae]
MSGKVKYYKVDVNECREIASEAGISAMPTFIVYKKGSPIDSLKGALADGLAKLKLLKDKYVGSNLAACSTALDQFLDLKYKDVVSFCSAICLANQRLVLAGVLKDNQVKMMIVLRKLPKNQF